MNKGFQAWEIGGLNIFIKDDVEYINAVGASRSCNSGIMYFFKDIVEYIDVEDASYLCNRGITNSYTSYCRIY